MSGPLEDVVKRWTAKRESALVIEIIQGKTTVAAASRSYDLSPPEIEGWINDARRGMENALRAKPLDIRVSLVKLCTWFGAPRRTVYYKPTKAAPQVDLRFAQPIKAMIEENPSFAYRTVAFLLGFNKNKVQRIFQLNHWQVRKRPIGMRSRIQALPSVATAPNERWSTDLCRIWAGKDGCTSLSLVI